MISQTIGFIGGGRVTRVILGGFKRAGEMPKQVVVGDTNIEVLNKLKEGFPEINIAPNDNKQPASKDIVFVALHPPVVSDVLNEIKSYVKPESIIVSLAPKLTIAKISERLQGFDRVVRILPNAPSIVNAGYNPIAFSQGLTETEKKQLISLFSFLGECPIVSEEKLEGYAILTAMGPTYLWFQLYEMQEIGKLFGLNYQEVEDGISKMVMGTVKTMRESGLSPAEIMDLIPVKPLEEEQENIKNIYRSKLEALFEKLKG
jgi:pyrroline-5-carboxylate reductase